MVAKAIRKYGEPLLVPILQDQCDIVAELEIDLIEHLSTLCPSGYNLDLGGSVRKVSQEERKRMSMRAKAQDHSYLQDPEIRARQGESMKAVWKRPGYKESVSKKISAGNKGKPKSDAHCRAMSVAQKSRQRNLTDEQRQRARELGRAAALKRWRKV